MLFGEYKCSGQGADYSNRVPYAKQLKESEVSRFLDVDFIDGTEWLPNIETNVIKAPMYDNLGKWFAPIIIHSRRIRIDRVKISKTQNNYRQKQPFITETKRLCKSVEGYHTVCLPDLSNRPSAEEQVALTTASGDRLSFPTNIPNTFTDTDKKEKKKC